MEQEIEPAPFCRDPVEYRLQLTGLAHVARYDDGSPKRFREGPHMGLGFGVEVGDGQLSSCLAERARASISDAAVIGDPGDEAALAGEIDDRLHEGALPARNTKQASSAMTCSSSVGMTSTAIVLAVPSIRVALRAFAVASSVTPSQARCRQTASRICGWCSPIPAVKMSPSSPPSVLASATVSRAMRTANRLSASCASGAVLPIRSRLSALMPDTPSRPER